MAALHRRQIVAELHLKRMPQAEMLGYLERHHGIVCSRFTISKDLRKIRQAWRESMIRDWDTAKGEELEQLYLARREAWAAYERSIGKHTVITKEGNEGATKSGKSTTTRKKVSIREEEHAGSPEWMRVILDIEKKICDLLGLEAPTKMELMGRDGGPIVTKDESEFNYDRFARAFAAFAHGLSDPSGVGPGRADGDPQPVHPEQPQTRGLPVAQAGALPDGAQP
jgi:hypothetical protein